MSCRAIQVQMASVLAGGADRRERLEVEAHTARCARCATAYADLIATSVALHRAYAPLRAETASLSPVRLRPALARPGRVPGGIRFGRLAARATELTLAAAVTAFAFVGSASLVSEPAPRIVDEASADVALDAGVPPPGSVGATRQVRAGRYAALPDLVDPLVLLPSHADDTTLTDVRDRAGALR